MSLGTIETVGTDLRVVACRVVYGYSFVCMSLRAKQLIVLRLLLNLIGLHPDSKLRPYYTLN